MGETLESNPWIAGIAGMTPIGARAIASLAAVEGMKQRRANQERLNQYYELASQRQKTRIANAEADEADTTGIDQILAQQYSDPAGAMTALEAFQPKRGPGLRAKAAGLKTAAEQRGRAQLGRAMAPIPGRPAQVSVQPPPGGGLAEGSVMPPSLADFSDQFTPAQPPRIPSAAEALERVPETERQYAAPLIAQHPGIFRPPSTTTERDSSLARTELVPILQMPPGPDREKALYQWRLKWNRSDALAEPITPQAREEGYQKAQRLIKMAAHIPEEQLKAAPVQMALEGLNIAAEQFRAGQGDSKGLDQAMRAFQDDIRQAMYGSTDYRVQLAVDEMEKKKAAERRMPLNEKAAGYLHPQTGLPLSPHNTHEQAAMMGAIPVDSKRADLMNNVRGALSLFQQTLPLIAMYPKATEVQGLPGGLVDWAKSAGGATRLITMRKDPRVQILNQLPAFAPLLAKSFRDTGNVALAERIMATDAMPGLLETDESGLQKLFNLYEMVVVGIKSAGLPIPQDLRIPQLEGLSPAKRRRQQELLQKQQQPGVVAPPVPVR